MPETYKFNQPLIANREWFIYQDGELIAKTYSKSWALLITTMLNFAVATKIPETDNVYV